MSFAFFDEETILRPGIIGDCPELTGEEWLTIMKAKSIAQGKALTWRQIKDDPGLDHEQISLKLGPYASYQNSLFCSVRKIVLSHEVLTGTAERHYAAAMAVKTQHKNPYSAGAKPLMQLQTPGTISAWSPHYIVAGSTEPEASEKWLSSFKLELTDSQCDMSASTMEHIFRGEGRTSRIMQAIVYANRIEFIAYRVNKTRIIEGTAERMLLTAKPGADARLFLGVARRGVDAYDDYAVCGCKGMGGQTRISVLSRRQAGIA